MEDRSVGEGGREEEIERRIRRENFGEKFQRFCVGHFGSHRRGGWPGLYGGRGQNRREDRRRAGESAILVVETGGIRASAAVVAVPAKEELARTAEMNKRRQGNLDDNKDRASGDADEKRQSQCW